MRLGATGRTHLAILLVYALLAVLLTWPTAAHLATHLPGDGGDDPAIAWNLWWVKQALLTLRTNPLFTDFMFYPLGVNLAFYTLTTLNALTALPLTLALGVVAASNLHMWFTFVVGGYGAFLLARHVLAHTFGLETKGDAIIWPAAMAGGFYAFASSQLFYVSLGQFNIASSHWVPYTILFILKSRRDLVSPRWPALAALFLIMQTWAEMTYATFLLVFIALYVVYELATHKSANRKSQISNLQFSLRNLLLLSLLFALGLSPLLAVMLPDMRAEGDFWVEGSGFAEVFSADLAGFVVPTVRHPLFGELVTRTDIGRFNELNPLEQQVYKGQHIYLGVTLVLLAIAGVIVARRGGLPWFWLFAALFFAWLTLGSTVRVNGIDTGIPGPFLILQSLPFFKGNRYPSRYSVMLVLSLAMLAAIGASAIWTSISRALLRRGAAPPPPHRGTQWPARRSPEWGKVARVGEGVFPTILPPALCCLLSAVFLLEHLAIPLPQSDMRVPEPYQTIAAGPGRFTLLDIPVAWRNGFRITGPHHSGFMFGQFYQTVHGGRLLQGNTSRNPEFKFQYFTEAPVINSLLALETGHELPPRRWVADRAIAGDVLRFLDIQYIVVRPAPGAGPGVTPEAAIPYIEKVMPVQRVYADSTLTLYRVDLPPLPEAVEVSLAAPLARLYFADGWGALADQRMDKGDRRVWAQRRDARLLVPLDGKVQQVTLRLFVPGSEGQKLTLRMNGWNSEVIVLQPGWGEYDLTLPDEAVRAGLNDLYLHFDQTYPIVSLPGPGDVPFHSLLVESAGEEMGDFGHIYMDGVDVSPDRRGYNLAAISPDGDAQVASFDTHLDPGASAAMAAFIAALPEGYTVAVAAADKVSMNLGEEAVAALRSIGAEGDLRGRFRWSHAVIGRKGAEPGTALEALDGLRPVSVAVGPPLSEPRVAAATEWIRFEAKE